MTTFNFHEAFKLMREGIPMSRGSWPENTFVFAQHWSNVPANIVENMTSLPEKVKTVFMNRRQIQDALGFNQELKYRKQLCKVNADNFLEGYLPNGDDLFAEDWFIYTHQNN